MLEFKPVTLEDKPWIDEIVAEENSRSADFDFGNIYIWDRHFKQLVARSGKRIVTKLRYGGRPAFAFPIGSGSLEQAVLAVKEFADYKKYPLRFYGVEKHNAELLEQLFPGKFSFQLQEGQGDYIYSIDKLSTYAGKALHGKKNHCNRFEKEHPGWSFQPITRELVPDCLDFLSVWQETNAGRLEESITNEHDAIVRAFAAYEKLGLEGGALFADGRIIGFSLGERCSSDCFDVHFEKAEIDINGAYTMVCRELAKMVKANHPEIEYINREEDMQIEGMRKSKESYKPEYILEKYLAEWNYD